MKISISKPPIYDECVKVFDFGQGTVFTYGDVLYNPDNIDIPDHLMAHEECHAEQQVHNEIAAKLWWQKYLADEKFRIDQEVEAYGAQYKFICNKIKDKNSRYINLHIMADYLSSPMYGSAISYTDAIRRIRMEAVDN